MDQGLKSYQRDLRLLDGETAYGNFGGTKPGQRVALSVSPRD